MRYCPAEFVCTVRAAPVPVLVTVTEALGIMLPEGSKMSPTKVAAVCANTADAVSANVIAAKSDRAERCIIFS